MNNDLQVQIESIMNTKNILSTKYEEIYSMFKKYQMMIEETEDIYDTESGKLYREIGIKYVEMAMRYLNNNLKPCIDFLDDIKNSYDELYTKTAKEVNGGE